VQLVDLRESSAFNGTIGVIQRFDELQQVYFVRITPPEGRPVLKKVRGDNLLFAEAPREELAVPALALALAINQDPAEDAEPPSPLSPASLPSARLSPRHAIMKKLHFSQSSILGKLLYNYSRMVVRRPKLLIFLYSICMIVPTGIGLVLRGFELETDFSAFMRADGRAMREREAFELVLEERKAPTSRRLREEEAFERHALYKIDDEWVETEEPAKNRTGRLLDAQVRRLADTKLFIRKEFTLMHTVSSGSALQERVLREALDVETRMRKLPIFHDICHTKITGESKLPLCDPGVSLNAFAWPEHGAGQGDVRFKLAWNARGRDILQPAALLAYMKTDYADAAGELTRSPKWYFPKSFRYPDIGAPIGEIENPPEAIRTLFSFHLYIGFKSDPVSKVKEEMTKIRELWDKFVSQELHPYLVKEQIDRVMLASRRILPAVAWLALR